LRQSRFREPTRGRQAAVEEEEEEVLTLAVVLEARKP
jgi:hypothetical protein